MALLERHSSFGVETSYRNSEIIHAEIYYGPNSLKTTLCIRGKELLYNFCKLHDIPHKMIGKWVIAHTLAQRESLEKLHAFCRDQINFSTDYLRGPRPRGPLTFTSRIVNV